MCKIDRVDVYLWGSCKETVKNKVWPRLAVIILMTTLFGTPEAHAAFGFLKKLGFTTMLGAEGGLGTMGDGSANVNRSMSSFGIHMMPSMKFGNVFIGPMAQYRFVGQMTDPATVGDINLGGSGYDVGLGIGFLMGRFVFRGSYDLVGSNSLSLPTLAGETSMYQKSSGFTAILSYRIKQNSRVLIDLYVSQHSFKEQSLSGVISDISSTPMKQLFYSLGLSFQLGGVKK